MLTALIEKSPKFTYMKRVTETVGDRIRSSRKAVKLSQPKLGRQLGLSGSAIAQWETDVTEPTWENLCKLGPIVKKSPHWLKTGEGPELPATELNEVVALLTPERGKSLIDYLELVGESPGAFRTEQDAEQYRVKIRNVKDSL